MIVKYFDLGDLSRTQGNKDYNKIKLKYKK